MHTRIIIAIVGLLAALGCAARQERVPLVGTASDITALKGEWSGDYWSSETGRTGSISFNLTARGDTALGNVVMVPAGMSEPLRPWSDNQAGPPTRARPEILTISFVRISGNEISGSLDPYSDPVCGCALYTRFVGRAAGDTIAGTYVSRHAQTGEEAHGSWKVTRRGS